MLKKSMSMILAMVMVFSVFTIIPFTSVNAESTKYLFGDLNSDGQINVTDLTAITNHLTGSVILTDEQQVLADVNGNGQVDMDDRQSIIDNIVYGTTFPVYSKLIDYGFCGEKVKYKLSNDGTFVAFGTGDMYDYALFGTNVTPWKEYGEQIKIVEVNEGVTSIGAHAFHDTGKFITRSTKDSIEKVKLPSTLLRIGEAAFLWCNSLASVNIPNSVTTINKEAFARCTALSNVVLSDSLSEISEGVFEYCESLKTLEFPKSVKVLGASAFSGAGFETITIPKTVTELNRYSLSSYSLKEVIIEGDIIVDFYVFSSSKNLEKAVFNGSITFSGKANKESGRLFSNCTNLKYLTIPSVFRFEDKEYPIQSNSNFYGCDNLEINNIVFNDNPKIIDNVVFSDDGKTLLWYHKNIKSKNYTVPDGTEKIAWNAFASNSYIEHVTLPDSLKELGGRVFMDCSKLNNVVIPEGINTLFDFQGCTSLKKIVIPISVVQMYDNTKASTNTFENITDLTAYCDESSYARSFLSYFETKDIVYCNFDANGGSVAKSKQAVIPSDKYWNLPTPTKQNASFEGWYTAKTEGTRITENSTVIPESSFTLYAHWSNDDLIKPSVSLSSTNNVATSQTVTISMSDNVGIRGYYWGTSSNYSNNSYTSTSNTSISKTVDASGTYYATAVDTSGNISSNVSITFYKTTLNANGGSVNPTSVLTKSGNSFTFPTPTRNSYTYNGWSTSSSASSGVKTLYPSSNTIYYVVWKSNNSFVWGQDNWRFDNTDQYFANYNVNSTVMNLMKADFGMSNSDIYELQEAIAKHNYYGFEGSCFGMTVSEILAKHGSLKLSRYGGYDIVHNNTNTSNMTSVINFIQELQSVSRCSQIIRQSPFMSGNHSQYDFIDKAESVLSNENTLIKLSYGICKFNSSSGLYSSAGYHAVLAYGIENYTYYSSVTGKTYDKRILIADPNYLSENKVYNDACIYYKSSDHSWICPYWYRKTSSYTRMCYWNANTSIGTKTGLIRNLMKYNSLTDTVDLMADYSVNHYISGLTVANESGNYSYVEQVEKSGNPNMDYAGDSGAGIARYDIEMDDSFNINENEEFYALWNPTANYTLSYSKPSDFKVKMDYDDIVYYADLSDATYMIFKPNGTVSFRGTNSDYSIKMVTNDSVCVTDWYVLTVSGKKTDDFSYIKAKDGYILSSDNLHNISIGALNDDVNITRSFSTEYDSVFIYEIDETHIGIKVDTDNNGTYETELPVENSDEHTDVIIGDVDGDGEVGIMDATLIQMYLAKLRTLDEQQLINADSDASGSVDILDATTIQMFLAKLIPSLGKR